MKLKIRDMQAEIDKIAEKDYLDLLDISANLVKKRIINYSNGLDLSI